MFTKHFIGIFLVTSALFSMGARVTKKDIPSPSQKSEKTDTLSHQSEKKEDTKAEDEADSSTEISKTEDSESKQIHNDKKNINNSCLCVNWPDVAKSALSSVVNIIATQQISQPKGIPGGIPKMPSGSLFDELFRDFFDGDKSPRKVQAAGSGFIIKIDDKFGYVVTNYHVVSEAKTIKITLCDKDEVNATLVAGDERSDLAIIKFELSSVKKIKDIKPMLWGDSASLMVAEPVMAIGNPFGFGGTVTTGIVSYKGRYLPNGAQQDFEFIQHSAQINMGNSGGCLLNKQGHVIGINTAIITPNAGNVGIGFAIPSNEAKRIINKLLETGYIKRGYLGIQIQEINDELRAGMNLDKDAGIILVGSVQEDGPSNGILEPGDVIIEFEEKKIKEARQLPSFVSNSEVGKKVALTILRPEKGNYEPTYKKIIVHITLAQVPQDKDLSKSLTQNQKDILEIEGLSVRNLTEEEKQSFKKDFSRKQTSGILIVSIDKKFSDTHQFLSKGDVIESINSTMIIHNIKDFEKYIQKAKDKKLDSINFQIWRPISQGQGASRFAPFKLSSVNNNKDKKSG
jgi:serine protease Do